MIDLDRQIRDYYDRIVIPVTTDEYTRMAVGAPIPVRRRRVWALAAGFVVVLVGIGIAAVWLSGRDSSFVDQPPTTSVISTTAVKVPPPTTIVSTVPSIDFQSLVWTRTPLSDVFGTDAEVAAVTPGGPGFVAVGSAEEGAAAVWTSSDALTWTRVRHDPEVFGRSASIDDVTAGGPGLVAVGGYEPEVGVVAPAVWTSPDGFSWSQITNDEVLWGMGHVHSVTAGGPGLVAVGSEHKTLEGAWEFSTVGRIWTSPDGLKWTQVPHNPEIFGDADSSTNRSSINQVVAGGPGFVAIGVLDRDAAVWTSRDGLVWTLTTEGLTWTSTVVDGGRIWDVTAGGPGLVAVGAYELDRTCRATATLDCYAAVWTSSDGITWDPVPHDAAVFGGGPDKQGMHAVTTIGKDLVAVGTSVWISKDGTNWTRIYDDPGFVSGEHSGMGYVFAAGETLIVFGEAAVDTNYVYLATERTEG